MSTFDPFRPHTEPAKSLYDLILTRCSEERTDLHWVHHLRLSVFRAAREYAQQHGLTYPTLEQVGRCESLALGHVDYAAKWAMYVAEQIKGVKR